MKERIRVLFSTRNDRFPLSDIPSPLCSALEGQIEEEPAQSMIEKPPSDPVEPRSSPADCFTRTYVLFYV